ncbi:MAG: prepilin-type N-terminal cleavage/methylation domain-containing protein [Acinetobacter sp.]
MYRTNQAAGASITSKNHKRGFTMIELIGAMIIIAVLTVAGISAVSTAINNSRITAVNEDLDGFRKVAEQFLLENPQTSKWNGVNSDAQLVGAFKLFNDKYLEGEMKIPNPVKSGQNALIIGYTQRKDPWGTPYAIIYNTQKLNCDSKDPQSTSYAKLYVRSSGKNGYNNWDVDMHSSMLGIRDADDIYSVTQFSNDRVCSTVLDTAQLYKSGKTFMHEYGYSFDSNSWCMLEHANIPGYRI